MFENTYKKHKKYILPAAAVVAVIVLWQLVAEFVVGDPFILPSFSDVLEALYKVSFGPRGTLFVDLYKSLIHFAMGIGAALVVGIPLGIAMGWFRDFDKAVNPIIEILRPIPPLAWIPFAIIWFGLTDASAGFIIFIGAVFPILINTYTGFRNVPRVFIEAGKVLGCTGNLGLIRRIAFPSSLPSIISGVRISMGIGWMCLVGAEIFGAGGGKYGLGKNLWTYYNLHQMPSVVVYMLVLGLIGLVIDMVFRYFVKKHGLGWWEENE